MLLLNLYLVVIGTTEQIVRAQSREEISTDKLRAFGLRPNRIKHRDLWDIAWLHQQHIMSALDLLDSKLQDHKYEVPAYLQAFAGRCSWVGLPWGDASISATAAGQRNGAI